MKRFILALLLLAVVRVGAQAGDGAKPGTPVNMVSKSALKNFAFQFFEATNVTWRVSEDFQKAVFNIDGKVACAMYDQDGRFLMASEQVEAGDLPAYVKADIKEKHAGYRISDAVKVLSRPAGYDKQDDTGSYWIALVNDTDIVYLVASPGKSVKIISKGTISK